jgi:hypothetical protein
MSRIVPGAVLILTAALCGAQTRDVPGMAVGVLHQADLARQAVRNHDQAAAIDHIRQAQSLATEIQSRSDGQPQPLLVPVQSVTETTSTMTDVKRHKDGDVTLKKHSHIGAVEAQTTAQELNVTAAAESLNAASADLQRNDWAAADADLARIGNLIQRDTADRAMPLSLAEQNLGLARQRLAEQKYGDAVLPLREAERALSDFAKQSSGPRSQEAADMQRNIEAMAAHIHKEGSTERIDEWMRTVQSWEKQ